MTGDAWSRNAPLPAAGSCAVCGATLVGAYCHACGQASAQAPRSLRTALTGQTGKLVYTLRRLLQPGELAREIDHGRDRLAVRPLTLLLNLIPLFFLFGGGVSGFSAHTFISADPSGRLATLVTRAAERNGVATALQNDRVEQRFKAVYSILVVVQALAYGAVIGLLERRKRKAWLVHFATAIHYVCFNFILSTLVFAILRLVHGSIVDHPGVAATIMLCNSAYMAISVHRVYSDRWLLAVGKTALIMGFGYLVAVVLTVSSVTIAVLTA